MSWLLGCSGWACVLLVVLLLRRRRGLVADAEHELRGAATALSLAAERMSRAGATRAFASLVALQLERMEIAVMDLGRACRLCPRRRRPAERGSARKVDSGRLSQVVANLVDNAAEHGTGPVDVRWSPTGTGVRLEIRNANRPRELDELAAARASGRGRGLGIAGRAARELGGSLRVDSGAQWTTATLDLPAQPERGRSRAA